MYKHLFLLAIVAVGLNACGPVYVVQQPTPPPQADPAPSTPPPANPEEVSYQTFYDQLSPYGQWIQDPQYGYVWMPEVGPDFKPYGSAGHWVYTDEGWAWDSDYPWGWAAFHYGRWFFRDGYGWMWIPGTEWAPAWVTWRNSDDYYGWAPMEPGISVNVAYSGGYNPPPHYWCFVPHQYVASPHVNNYYVRETNNVTIINRTTVINNTTINNTTINNYNNTTINNHNTTIINNHYGAGPDPNEVSRYSGTQLRPMPIRESRNPGALAVGGAFAVYRPRVNSAPPAGNNGNNDNNHQAFAPARFHTLSNVQPVNRTNYGSNPAQSNNPPANNGWENRDNRGNQDNRNNWDNRGQDNRGQDNRGQDLRGQDNRDNRGQDNRQNNPPANNNGWNNNNNGWHNGQQNTPPASNPPAGNQTPPNNQPFPNRQGFPDNQGTPINRGGVTNPGNTPPAQPGRPFQPAAQPTNQPARPFQAGRPFQPAAQPASQPASQPAPQQAAPANRPMMIQRHPFGQPNNASQNTAPQNTVQPRPVGNAPKPAPPQRIVPPPQKKDDNGNPNKP